MRSFWGDLMALVGAWLSGGYLLVGRKVRGRVSLQSYLIIVYGIAAIALLLMAALKGERFTGYSPETNLWMVCLALFPQVIGHSVFNWSLKYLSAAYVSIALLGEPVGTVILSMIFLREFPTMFEIMGGVLILSGILLATRSNR
jgi:drug/metabolite transporter (DMT)-like permease